MRAWSMLALVACASPPPPAPRAAVAPPPIVEASDAGHCEPSRGDDVLADPPVVGTYPKVIPRLDEATLAARRNQLGARDPGVDFRLDDFGYVVGFGVQAPFLADESGKETSGPLTERADVRQLATDAQCAHADLRGFVPTSISLGGTADAPVVYFERPHTYQRLPPLVELPAPMDSALLARKWKLTVEYARERVTSQHRTPLQHCLARPGEQCDPRGGELVTNYARTVLGKMDVPAKYLIVTVRRVTTQRPAGLEMRLVATAEVDLGAFERQVLAPRFGADGQAEIVGDPPQAIDAVTGDPLGQGK